MKKLQEKIMAASFGKLLKRWIIAVLCVTLLGGGASAALLAPQIGQVITAAQSAHEQRDRWEHDFQNNVYDREEAHRDRLDAENIFYSNVSCPSTAAVISVGVTILLCSLLALCFWLLVAVWLYQAAVLSGMNGPLWGVLGLLGNVCAAILFAIVRGFLRKKCPDCGRWQDNKAAYCAACGGAMVRKCPACGADCPIGSRFCPACGTKLEGAASKGEATC